MVSLILCRFEIREASGMDGLSSVVRISNGTKLDTEQLSRGVVIGINERVVTESGENEANSPLREPRRLLGAGVALVDHALDRLGEFLSRTAGQILDM